MSPFGSIGCKGLRGQLGPVGDSDSLINAIKVKLDGPFRKPSMCAISLLDDPILRIATI